MQIAPSRRRTRNGSNRALLSLGVGARSRLMPLDPWTPRRSRPSRARPRRACAGHNSPRASRCAQPSRPASSSTAQGSPSHRTTMEWPEGASLCQRDQIGSQDRQGIRSPIRNRSSRCLRVPDPLPAGHPDARPPPLDLDSIGLTVRQSSEISSRRRSLPPGDKGRESDRKGYRSSGNRLMC